MADEENDGDTRSLQPARGAERVLSTGANGCIFTAGRPPWYSTDGVRSQAFVIGITGGSASGKTSVAEQIIAALDVPWVCLLSMDSFYKVLGPAELELAHANNFNFDHPGAPRAERPTTPVCFLTVTPSPSSLLQTPLTLTCLWKR